jgi:putative ABC transport system ATP-binding protein
VGPAYAGLMAVGAGERTAVAVTLGEVRRTFRVADAVEVRALDAVTARIEAGTVAALWGPSGSGKSTLLHVLAAIEPVDSGEVVVGERDLAKLERRELVAYRRSIGLVFQRFHLISALTALDNVVAPLMPYRVGFDGRARGRELLDAVGLAGRAESLPGRMSGGEQQRVAIARALINRPSLLLADEPTGNLDSANGRVVIDLLLALRERFGVTVVIATHDAAVAERCDRVIQLIDGRVSE